jgi:hypothetical protein
MGGKPATTSSYTGGVAGPGFGGGAQQWTNGQTPFGLNNWSPENPALGQYNELWNKNAGMSAFNAAANTPYQTTNAALQQAQGYFGGDPSLVNSFMNPYTQNVLNQMQTQYGLQNQNVLGAAADQAQGQNAYGGSRSDIMAGTALSNNQMNQAGQMSNLLQQGYGQAQGLASNAASNLNQMGQYQNQQANQATMFKPEMMAAGFGAYPQMTLQGSSGQPSGASNAAKGAGTVAEMAPLLAMFL